jgi:hypothetical protein
MFRPAPLLRRGTLWLFALALLLKAAVPMLASAAAEMQGKTLVEVCTVYGIKTVAVDGGHADEPAPAGHAGHGAEHCALAGVVAGGALEAPSSDVHVAGGCCTDLPTPPPPQPAPPDACAAWVAQLKHGPPSFA